MIQKNIDIYKVAGWGLVDEVIDPRDTRRAIAWGLELAATSRSSGRRRSAGSSRSELRAHAPHCNPSVIRYCR